MTVSFSNILEVSLALTDCLHQPTASHKVVLVLLDVLGQLFDSLCKYADLNDATASVLLVRLQIFDDLLLLFSCNHIFPFTPIQCDEAAIMLSPNMTLS